MFMCNTTLDKHIFMYTVANEFKMRITWNSNAIHRIRHYEWLKCVHIRYNLAPFHGTGSRS